MARGEPWLDRELCFKKWVELGTLANVANWFKDQGIISKHTGRAFSRVAISYAARRWVCLNPLEAREYYNQCGWYPDDALWNDWLVKTAVKVFHSHPVELLQEFLDQNGLREQYGYIIGEGKS